MVFFYDMFLNVVSEFCWVGNFEVVWLCFWLRGVFVFCSEMRKFIRRFVRKMRMSGHVFVVVGFGLLCSFLFNGGFRKVCCFFWRVCGKSFQFAYVEMMCAENE